jgi:hypothetical protein
LRYYRKTLRTSTTLNARIIHDIGSTRQKKPLPGIWSVVAQRAIITTG